MEDDIRTAMLKVVLANRARAKGYKHVEVEVEIVPEWPGLKREMWTVTVSPPRHTYPDHVTRKKGAPRIPVYDIFNNLPFDQPVLWDRKEWQAVRAYREKHD